MQITRPFRISKQEVWQAYLQVKANNGSAGVDKQSVANFDENRNKNLYKLWNRMASGTYFPPPVKGVSIPKKSGGTRLLGIPTVSDRIAQMVVKRFLEPQLDPMFDRDSYGYRPNKSAHQALGITRRRCWRQDWVVDFDIKGLFDNIDHTLLIKALQRHCTCRWVLLYVERWLKAPLELPGGELIPRQKGTPQGGVVSPLLANLFLHYAFDAWVRRELPEISFCRYADDGLLHCNSLSEAQQVLAQVTERFKVCGLEIHPEKSGIIYCKDGSRPEQFEKVSFDFLGYTFKPRRAIDKRGIVFCNFSPGVSTQSKKAMIRKMRAWAIPLRNAESLESLSDRFNRVLIGWFNYYGKYYQSGMQVIAEQFNLQLLKWIKRKYKRFEGKPLRAWEYLKGLRNANRTRFKTWSYDTRQWSNSGRCMS